MHKVILTGLFAVVCWGASAVGAASSTRPNFVIIFTDDQGYGDLSCFGGTHVDTPRIDKMAAEGARLTSFYVAAPVCTPSRAGLMTGCYPKRIGMATGSNFGVLLAGDPKGLHPNESTIAEVLKDAGYKTGMFGKWDLAGHNPAKHKSELLVGCAWLFRRLGGKPTEYGQLRWQLHACMAISSRRPWICRMGSSV